MKIITPSLPSFKGNTHVHTTLSDGRLSPEEVIGLYHDNGYDFLAITDHWHTYPSGTEDGMLILSGAEYDFRYPDQVLHVVGLYPDDRTAPQFTRRMTADEILSGIHAVGGIAIAAHPAWSLNTPDFLKNLTDVDGAEVYNTFSGEPWNAPRADSSSILDLLATAGHCLPWIAADDSHRYRGEQCRSYIMVQAKECTCGAILSAIREGKYYASQGPRFEEVELTAGHLIVHTSPVNRISFVSNLPWVGERCRNGEGMTQQAYALQPGETFIRCVITDIDGNTAWLSPIAL